MMLGSHDTVPVGHRPRVRGVSFLALVLLQAASLQAAEERFESDLIARALEALDLVPDPEPEGKLIERILIVRFPIIEPSDPWPDFLNLFHVTTREHIVRQELLFSEGERYDPRKAQESARNLRAFPLTFSTVRIVTARGSAPDGVAVVVITKDLWSIRLNSALSVGGGVFNYLQLMPTEQNFLGYNQQLSLYTFTDRDTVAYGPVYVVPRLLGSRLRLLGAAGLRQNWHGGEMEGGFGQLEVSRPLFSVDERFGYSAYAAFDLGTERLYQGTELRRVLLSLPDGTWILPEKYLYQKWRTGLSGVYSLGKRYKTDLEFGYELRSYGYGVTDDFPDAPEVEAAFRQAVVPADDRAGSLVAEIHFYEATFRRFQNIQSYGLSEDFRFGPEARLALAWSNPAFGFATQAIRARLELGWMFLLGKDILSLRAAAAVRYSPQLASDGIDSLWRDRLLEAEIENVSPPILGGRLFARVHYIYSQFSRARTRYALGGDNTLRGFVSGFTAGERLFNVNLEYRSRPWVIRTLHWGFTLFYDGGDAYGFGPADDFSYHQSVGFGIRALFPQFDRGVMRLDVGVPLGKDFNTQVVNWVSLAFLQAF
ncbi:MAG: BamA/TamA family outer membrane protein [Myxococcales bacterium]|nr:BamA/TamA family outer membrane protein [Myxococcales bacterium]